MIWWSKPGSTKAYRREPRSCMGWVFNFKLGCLCMSAIAWHIQAPPHLKLKTRPRFCNVSLSLSMSKLINKYVNDKNFAFLQSPSTLCLFVVQNDAIFVFTKSTKKSFVSVSGTLETRPLTSKWRGSRDLCCQLLYSAKRHSLQFYLRKWGSNERETDQARKPN
jgi:hypothetical protein